MLKEYGMAALLITLYLLPLLIGTMLAAYAAWAVWRKRFTLAVAFGATGALLICVFVGFAVSWVLGMERIECRRCINPQASMIREQYRFNHKHLPVPPKWLADRPVPSCSASVKPQSYLYFAVPDVNSKDAERRPQMACPHPHTGCTWILFSPFADKRPCRLVLFADSWVRSVPETQWQVENTADSGATALLSDERFFRRLVRHH